MFCQPQHDQLITCSIGVGVPCMLLYVYGVVPFSICRNGCYGASTQDVAERARDTLRIDLGSGNGSSINPIQTAFDTVSLPGPSMHRGMDRYYLGYKGGI